jgi:hypothetical protein
MKLVGKISVRIAGEGTKSEHEAVYLDTGKESYQLRKTGSNPFENPELKQMAGREVSVEGTLDKYIFFARTIEEI